MVLLGYNWATDLGYLRERESGREGVTACLFRNGWSSCCKIWQTPSRPPPSPCLFSFSVQGLGFCSETQQKATGHFLLIAVGEGILCAFGRHYANRGGGEGRR